MKGGIICVLRRDAVPKLGDYVVAEGGNGYVKGVTVFPWGSNMMAGCGGQAIFVF